MKNFSAYAIAAALTLNPTGEKAQSFQPQPPVLNQEVPQPSEEIIPFEFSFSIPRAEENEMPHGISSMVIDSLRWKAGCKENNPAKILEQWFASQGVPVAVRIISSDENNKLTWFGIEPKDEKDRESFNKLTEFTGPLARFESLSSRPFKPEDLPKCPSVPAPPMS